MESVVRPLRWTIKPKPEQEDLKHLTETLGVPPLIARLLAQRGITSYDDARRFFRPQWSDLHDPFLMKDMEAAVQRIREALAKGENILVYGDYDVDGTTAVALVYSFLRERSERVATYIPDRYREGYGISFEGIDFADDNDFSLIIALDCGVKAIEQVNYAKSKGIDFIICDHHTPGSILPDAVAVLDPKRDDCTYPYRELCGCGIGFKLVQALAGKSMPAETLLPYLDLAAIAIGADIVPVTGENRVLAHLGLQVINSNPRPGIGAMLAGIAKSHYTINDVVFILAPRINAAGRMEHGARAVELLTAIDKVKAAQLASDVEQYNAERRGLDRQITQEALEQIEINKEEDRYTSVVYDESWHKGVIGIVASRLTETYYRPTLVFTKSGDKLAASARSVKGFNVYRAIESCSDHLIQFGGHKYAAGLTLEENQYDAFKAQFEDVVSATISPDMLCPEISVDAEIGLNEITPKLLRILKQFAPFGPGNRNPVFLAEKLMDTGYAKGVGESGKHLKCTLYQTGSPAFGGIGFNLGAKLSAVQGGRPFDAVFSLEENEWNGQVSVQLKIRDLR